MAGFFSKLIVFIVNIAFLIAGLCVLTFGIITLASPSTVISALNYIPGFANINDVIDLQQAVLNSGVLMIVIGSVITVICILGLVASCCNNKCLRMTYILLVLLVLFFELAVIIYASFESKFVESRIQSLMYSSLTQYFTPVQISNSTGEITNSTANSTWSVMQFEYGCCGAYGYQDYFNTSFNWQIKGSPGYLSYQNAIVPPSCCEQIVQYEFPTSTSEIVNLPGCMYSPPTYTNTKGCYLVVLDYFFIYGYIKIIALACLVAIEVIVSILSAHLLQTHRHEGDKC